MRADPFFTWQYEWVNKGVISGIPGAISNNVVCKRGKNQESNNRKRERERESLIRCLRGPIQSRAGVFLPEALDMGVRVERCPSVLTLQLPG